MRLFLHIGTRKTGSSLIQNFCQLNKAQLLAQGYFYPDNNYFGERKGKSAGHWRLHKVFEEREQHTLESYLPSPCPVDNVILSNEALTTDQCDIFNMPQKAWKLLSEKFQVTVIIYLRRQDLYIGSLYNEGIISGNHKSVWSSDEFLAKSHLPELDYYTLVQSWIEVFGKENVRIRPFEKKQFYQDDLIKDFLHCIDLGWKDDFALPTEESRNSSPNIVLVEAVRLFNRIPLRMRPMYRDFLDRVFDELVFQGHYRVKTQQRFLSPAVCTSILERYASGNAQVARELLGRADGKLFYEPEPQKDEPWEPVTVNDPDLVARLVSLFLEQKGLEIEEDFAGCNRRLKEHRARLDSFGKLLKEQQNQLDSYRQLFKGYQVQIENCARQLREHRENISREFVQNFLSPHVLIRYQRARKNPWKRFCRFLRSPGLNEVKLLYGSGLVDPHYYFEEYSHAITAGLPAAEHYLRYGAQQGNNPSAQFNTVQYLVENPDAAYDGINPLVHFILTGKEKRGTGDT